MTSSNPKYYLKASSPKTITWGVKASAYEFWRDTIKSIAVTFLKMGHGIFFFKECPQRENSYASRKQTQVKRRRL